MKERNSSSENEGRKDSPPAAATSVTQDGGVPHSASPIRVDASASSGRAATPAKNLSGRSAARELARAALNELFQAAGIRRIVLVDDQALAAADATAIGLVEEIWRVKPKSARAVMRDLPDDAEVRADIIRETIDKASPGDRADILAKLVSARNRLRAESKLSPPDPRDELDEAHNLFCSEIDLLLEGYELIVLSPDAWEAARAKLMEDAFAKTGKGEIPHLPDTVVLFDIDLSGAALGEEGGKRLAISLFKEFERKPLVCGIVSSLVPPSDERRGWNSQTGIRSDELVFVSKRELSTSPMTFVAELKRVLLTPFVRRFREITSKVLEDAHTFAIKEVADVDVNDLVYSVIMLPHAEGEEEIETLRRIYDSFFRERMRRSAADIEELNAVVDQLRQITRLAPEAQVATKYTSWTLQRRETYDNIDEVNALHLPVEVGDVFRFTLDGSSASSGGFGVGRPHAKREPTAEAKPVVMRDAEQPVQSDREILTSVASSDVTRDTESPREINTRGKEEGPLLDSLSQDVTYVLLAQPCHTVIRSTGVRKLEIGTLARIVIGSCDPSLSHVHLLKWFSSDGQHAFVDFSDTVSVPFHVLDLCAFRDDGKAVISRDDSPPSKLREGSKERHRKVKEEAMSHVHYLRDAYSALAGTREQFSPPRDLLGGSPVVATITMRGTPTIIYNCQRVGRVSTNAIAALLHKYAYYVSHAVFPVDLGGKTAPSKLQS